MTATSIVEVETKFDGMEIRLPQHQAQRKRKRADEDEDEIRSRRRPWWRASADDQQACADPEWSGPVCG